MKKHILILFLFIVLKTNSQNIVPNYSFEDMIQCPDNGGELNFTSQWYAPTSGTSDYFNQCGAIGNTGVPSNFAGTQYAKTGQAYIGIVVYGSNPFSFREYAQTQLIDTLEQGKNYCISFNVNLPDNPAYTMVAITEMGLLLSNNPITSGNTLPLPYTPQITSPSGYFLNDTTQWVEISGTYSALGGEKYITIGNFKNDINTDTMMLTTLSAEGYYYVDDVSIYEIKNTDAGNDTTICNGNIVQLGNANYQGVTYSWQPTTGLSNANIGNPTASPAQTTTYYLTQTTACNITTDTVTVTVCDLPDVTVPNIFTPNNDGINDEFRITSKKITSLNCKIYNRWGILVGELTRINEGWDGRSTSGLQCTTGFYYYVLTATGEDGKEYDEKGFVSLVK